jgi:hypothetical protein
LNESSDPADALNIAALESPEKEEERREHWASVMAGTSRPLWQSYSRSNVWDEVPEIERYMQTLRPPRKAAVQVISGSPNTAAGTGPAKGRKPSLRVADFPTEVERPSLPVTPAPVRRGDHWLAEGEDDAAEELPAAEGVPNQADWVRLSADAFFALLRLSYLYWNLTEPAGTARGAATTTVEIS